MRLVATLLLALATAAAAATEGRVGRAFTITEVYIPGGKAEPKPRRDREPPLVVRLLEIRPASDGFRYDFEVTALEPGAHDLADFLTAGNPSDPPELPEIPLEITSGLENAGVVFPEDEPPAGPPELGGYRNTMIAVAAVWLAGLLGLLLWKRRDRASVPDAEETPAPTLAERLRPLVRDASAGALDDTGRAALERLIIAHWRERLPAIASLPPGEAMAELRRHPEASPLIRRLETWLHAPAGSQARATDLDELLAPYR